jgi:hypothetical protein
VNLVEYPLFDSRQLNESKAACFDSVQSQLRNTPERRGVLDAFSLAIREVRSSSKYSSVHVVFICTHNSRRSQLAQVWAQCIADDLNLGFLICHSAGTERSTFHPHAIEALVNRGFVFEKERNAAIEGHRVFWKRSGLPMLCFSKTLEDLSLPKEGFIAVTTCDDADRECPFIQGATHRISLPFVDPKVGDDGANAAKLYAERSDEIANQLLYVLGQQTDF